MKPFHESIRTQYSLDSTSLCLDVGAFHGHWAKEMAEKYGCRVIAFEPIPCNFVQAVCNTATLNTVCVVNSCLAASGTYCEMGVSNNSSGVYSPSTDRVTVSVVRVVPFLTCIGRVAVAKFNVEGAEYELLEIILNANLHLHIDNLQIQWHSNVPDWENRYKALKLRLSASHVQEWSGAEFVWENYRMK